MPINVHACVLQLRIRAGNTIDAMQFIYANGPGTLAGNPEGGQEHSVVLNDKYVNGLRMGFADFLLCFVQVLFTDGTVRKLEGLGDDSRRSCERPTRLQAPVVELRGEQRPFQHLWPRFTETAVRSSVVIPDSYGPRHKPAACKGNLCRMDCAGKSFLSKHTCMVLHVGLSCEDMKGFALLQNLSRAESLRH